MRNASIANSSGEAVVFGSCVVSDSGLGIALIRLSGSVRLLVIRLSEDGGVVEVTMNEFPVLTAYRSNWLGTGKFSRIVGGVVKRKLIEKM